MVSQVQEAAGIAVSEVWIPEFGLFGKHHIEASKTYQGRIYRLSSESAKTIAELLGFTANFEAPAVRHAYLDVYKTEGRVVFEIDRNTKPGDLTLRYMRDRWASLESAGKGQESGRPWVRTDYVARFLPDKVFQGLAETLKVKPEQLEHFFLRVNLKERTVGLVTEDQFAEEFPPGAFQMFALPEGHMPAISTLEIAHDEAHRERKVASSAPTAPQSGESGLKFATYSKSEIDRMFKLQTESIANALGGKISSQQRTFQDAVTAQEKNFSKLLDKLATSLEESRSKLEAHAKVHQDATHAELEQFKTMLSKELDQFKAHINKNVVPVSKALEEKVKALEAPVKGAKQPKAQQAESPKDLKLIKTTLAAVLVVCVINAALIAFAMFRLAEITATTPKSASDAAGK